jgi:anti-anti-sigma factor
MLKESADGLGSMRWNMQNDFGGLLVYDAGVSTLIGFKDVEVVDDQRLEAFREGLQSLIQENQCKTLVIDLTGVKIVSSGTLGFLFSLNRQGVTIKIYNPSEGIREVLEITKLGQVFKEVDTPHG